MNLTQSSDAITCLSTEIDNKTSKFTILNLGYSQPRDDATLFEKYLKYVLSKKDLASKAIQLTGDFSINLLGFHISETVQDFVISLFNFVMIATLNKATCVIIITATEIDHVFTNAVVNTKFKTGIMRLQNLAVKIVP